MRKGVRASQNIFRSRVPIFTQRPNGNGGDVALVDRRCGNVEVGPAHDVTGADLVSPPLPGVRSKHSRTKKAPFEAGVCNHLLDLRHKLFERIGGLKQRMRGLEGCGKKYEAARSPENPWQGSSHCRARRHPHEKYRVNVRETGIERVGNGKVSAHDFSVWREAGVLRTATHPSYGMMQSRELREHLSPNRTRSADK